MRTTYLVPCLALLCGACSVPPLTFHVVDAETGHPLPGVAVHEEGSKISIVPSQTEDERRTLGFTDAGGVLATPPLRRDLGYHWDFDLAGYLQTRVSQASRSDPDVCALYAPLAEGVRGKFIANR